MKQGPKVIIFRQISIKIHIFRFRTLCIIFPPPCLRICLQLFFFLRLPLINSRGRPLDKVFYLEMCTPLLRQMDKGRDKELTDVSSLEYTHHIFV